MREINFVNGEYYHIYNRGVDRRRIFDSFDDYNRFVQSAYLFNDEKFVSTRDPLDKVVLLSGSEVFGRDQVPHVGIKAFSLMPNHYHFFMRQNRDHGISRYFHKLNKGYSRYYNNKNNRSGALFEGSFKIKHIDSDAYFEHIAAYIHLNPLELYGVPWRTGVVEDWEKSKELLSKYMWSSHPAYLSGNQDFPLVDLDFFKNMYRNPSDYLDYLKQWSTREMPVSLLKHLAVTE
jgi:putative transposase